jgi:Protein of unknown function (DUF3047)
MAARLIRLPAATLLLALASMPAALAQAPLIAAFPATGDTPPAPWHIAGLPHQTKPFTRFALADVDGRRALRVQADESYGNLVHPLVLAAPATSSVHLSWQWRVDQLIADANLREKGGDDTALKVCVFFDLPLDKVPLFERQLLRLARTQTPEPLPGATVCYVWDARLAAGTTIDNAYTRRVRYLVLETGPAQPHQWVHERRDLAADFTRLFGAESAQVPPVVGVAVGADADNTHGHSLGHVADLVLEP